MQELSYWDESWETKSQHTTEFAVECGVNYRKFVGLGFLLLL